MKNEVLLFTDWPIGPKTSGKVRDIYDLDPYLLIVTTDRISAFDVVMDDTIPFKGHVLNKLSVLWLKRLANIVPNHFLTDNVAKYPAVCQPYAQELKGRSMLVKKAKPLPVECIVRGYLSGSAWKDYLAGKNVYSIRLPEGLLESEELAEPIFTPSTKAEHGFHDENITVEHTKKILGLTVAHVVREKSLELYVTAQKLAEQAGIIIADTKFEFGFDSEDNLILIDEVLTPDSSRFWPADKYVPGRTQESFDKQYLRDYLESTGWSKKPPAPALPKEVIQKTSDKYLEAYGRLLPILS